MDLSRKGIRDIPTGLPLDLTQLLRDTLNIKTFIETGTGLGRSSEVASRLFDIVYTIEANEKRYKNAVSNFAGRNVRPIHGESPEALRKLVGILEEKHPQETFLFFLDAHCFFRPQVTSDACPLLEEIELIDGRHVIYVDDESAFTSAPHPRDLRKDYPELPAVIEALRKNNPERYIIIERKVIAGIPRQAQDTVDDFIYNRRKKA